MSIHQLIYLMETTFASRVRRYRQDKGLSQQAFAELCGLTQGNIAHMENGTEPKQSNVSKLLAGLPDLSPDWLLIGTGPMLRDGRALTPTPRAAELLPAQQHDYTTGPGTVNTVVETLLRERLADKDTLIEMLRAELSELRGKPSDSSDAAGISDETPTDPHAPTFAGGAAPLPRLRVQGLVRYAEEAAELS